MQETDTYPYDPPQNKPVRFARTRAVLSTAVGALVAMALLVALGIWFYRLGVRDAENIPIIRAALTPEKERPENPGGAVAPHQGVAAYEVADGDASAAAAVVLAPEPPEPTGQDIAQGEITPVPPPQPSPEPPVAEAPEPPIAATPEPATPAPTDAEPTDTEPTGAEPTEPEQVAAAPQPEPQPAEDPDADLDEEPAPIVTGGTEYAPALSPVARSRPSNLQELARQAIERDRQAVGDLAARAANSAVQIQLAADPDEANVRRMWDRIRRANGDLLEDRTLAIQSTTSGGVTFYRLRVGPFRDGAEARAICQALKARGQDCIVARNG